MNLIVNQPNTRRNYVRMRYEMPHNTRTKKKPISANRLTLINLARPERFELPTTWFEASIATVVVD